MSSDCSRPIQVGFAVLGISKYHMFNFHYNIWLKKFPTSRLLFTDTDSLAYEVIGDDIYKGMGEIRDEFDFSEYPDDHPLYSIQNMKKVGKFKDEWHGQLMLKFVGLRPKLYTFDYEKLAHYEINEEGVEKVVKKNRQRARKVLSWQIKTLPKELKSQLHQDCRLTIMNIVCRIWNH